MDYSMIILLVIFVGMIFFMFRSNKKRQQQAAELQASLKPGTKVMTSAGIYGTVTRVDTDENKVWVESTPGTVIVVHSQAINQVTPEPEAAEATEPTAAPVEETVDAPAESKAVSDSAPEFGERIEDTASEATSEAPAAEQKPETER